MPAWGCVRREGTLLPEKQLLPLLEKQLLEEWLRANDSRRSLTGPYGELPSPAMCWMLGLSRHKDYDSRRILKGRQLPQDPGSLPLPRAVGTHVGGDQTSRVYCPALMPVRVGTDAGHNSQP